MISKEYYPPFVEAKYYRDMIIEPETSNVVETDFPEYTWNFGSINREEAEKRLKMLDCPAFLIRTSSKERCFALSLKNQDNTFLHYIISPHING